MSLCVANECSVVCRSHRRAQFLLIELLKGAAVYAYICARYCYFKCQKSCTCLCVYVKPRGNLATELETTALLARASNERGLSSLSKKAIPYWRVDRLSTVYRLARILSHATT